MIVVHFHILRSFLNSVSSHLFLLLPVVADRCSSSFVPPTLPPPPENPLSRLPSELLGQATVEEEGGEDDEDTETRDGREAVLVDDAGQEDGQGLGYHRYHYHHHHWT